MNGFPTASTQYNDMEGAAVVDWHGGPGADLFAFAESRGVDTTRWFPVTIDVYGFGSPLMDLYCVDREIAGHGMDEINKYAEEHGEVPIAKFTVSAKFSDLEPFVKRFSLVLTNRGLQSRRFNIVAEHDVSG